MLKTLVTLAALIGSLIAIAKQLTAMTSPRALAERVRSDIDLRELHLRNADDVESLGFHDFAAEYRAEADKVVPRRLLTYRQNRDDRGRQALLLAMFGMFSLLFLIYLIALLAQENHFSIDFLIPGALVLGMLLIMVVPMWLTAELAALRRVRVAVDEHLAGAALQDHTPGGP